jgi:aspartate oxidase
MSRWRAVVGQGARFERSGLVQIGLAGGHFEMRRFAEGGLAGGDVVTELSQAARNMVGRREIR